MKKTLFILATLTIGVTNAMMPLQDSELHVAAKANDYAKCLAILNRMPAQPIILPPAEVINSIQRTFGDPSTDGTTEHATSTKQLVKGLYDQTESNNQEKIKRAFKLRTALNVHGLIARECCDNTDDKLCKLLDPSQNDMFELDRSPLFQPNQTITIMGKEYRCTSVKKIYDPASNN